MLIFLMEVTMDVIESVYEDGTKYYNEQGQLHREDGPAIERPKGDKYYFKNGIIHREDGPAIEYADGDKEYYKNGKLHREDGPAIEYADGDKVFYKDGKLHREDGPAVEYKTGVKEYWIYVGSNYIGDFYAAYIKKSYRVKFRVIAGGHNFTAQQARQHWKNNPKCLELANRAISKFDLIKSLIEKS
jgi:hypothetical protein